MRSTAKNWYPFRLHAPGGNGKGTGQAIHVLKMLDDKYGMTEDDFITAELEVVPAFKARDVGIDRSMIGAYGQDDRASRLSPPGGLLPSWKIPADLPRHIRRQGGDRLRRITGIKSPFLQVFLDEIMEGRAVAATRRS